MASCLQFLKTLQSHKGDIGVLLFITSPFPQQLGLCKEGDFQKAPRDGGWLPGKPTTNRGLELSVQLLDFQKEEMRDGGWINHQWLMSNSFMLMQWKLKEIQKKRVQRISTLGNQNASMSHHAWPQTPPGQKLLFWTSLYISPHLVSRHLDLYLLISSVINQ